MRFKVIEKVNPRDPKRSSEETLLHNYYSAHCVDLYTTVSFNDN